MAVKVTDDKRPIDSLKPDPKNPKRHPESQVAAIAASIDEFGYVNKVVCRCDGMLIGGEGTLEALKRRGTTGDIEVREVETGEVDDEFWISVRGPLKHQAAALRALEAAMKALDGVTVDLGTITLG